MLILPSDWASHPQIRCSVLDICIFSDSDFRVFWAKMNCGQKTAVFDLKNITSCPTYKTRKVCKYLNNSNISKITFFDLNIWFLSRLDPKSSKMCHLRAGLSPYRRSKIQNKIFSQKIFQNIIFFVGGTYFRDRKYAFFGWHIFEKKFSFSTLQVIGIMSLK